MAFGGRKGKGFQPEILKQPDYVASKLRWILASKNHGSGKILFLSSAEIKGYIAGDSVGEKFNNIRLKIFSEQKMINEDELVNAMKK